MKKNIRRRKSPTYLQNIVEAVAVRLSTAFVYSSSLRALRLAPIPGISDPADLEEYDRLEAEEKKEWEEVRRDWEENFVKK